MNRFLLPSLVAVVALTLIGCEKKDESVPNTVDKAKNAVNDAANKMGDAWKDAQKSLEEKGQKTLDEWQPMVDKIKTKAGTLTGDAKTSADAMVQDIESGWAKTKSSLSDVKNAAGDKWATVSADFTNSLDDLGAKIKAAATKLGVN